MVLVPAVDERHRTHHVQEHLPRNYAHISRDLENKMQMETPDYAKMQRCQFETMIKQNLSLVSCG